VQASYVLCCARSDPCSEIKVCQYQIYSSMSEAAIDRTARTRSFLSYPGWVRRIDIEYTGHPRYHGTQLTKGIWEGTLCKWMMQSNEITSRTFDFLSSNEEAKEDKTLFCKISVER
jgi:hypothetical protein